MTYELSGPAGLADGLLAQAAKAGETQGALSGPPAGARLFGPDPLCLQDPASRLQIGTWGQARPPVAAMAQMMIAEGRDPSSVLEIHAFGRPGIGSGQPLGQLAATAITASGTDTPAPVAPGGLTGIRA